jgi:molecular chaperone Hsp33
MIELLEKRLGEIHSVTSLLEEGKTPEMILTYILGGLGLDIMEQSPVSFTCNCDKERVEKALISIGRKELEEMIDEGKSIEVNCHFCNTNYEFTVEDLKDLYEAAQ